MINSTMNFTHCVATSSGGGLHVGQAHGGQAGLKASRLLFWDFLVFNRLTS